MKKLFLFVLIGCGMAANAQHYYNEWIDYSKTYYKFKLAKTGLYRLPQATLAAAGLGNEAAENFQLWRNGQQVPIYTSVASGTFATADYIEFWGEMNDGKPDKELYKKPEHQLNDKWSLETDSATYFLTINPSGANLRLAQTPNNTAGNILMPEPYFMYTAGTYFRNQINPGVALPVGENLYSSSYDNGEGWTSRNLDSADKKDPALDKLTTVYTNLYLYTNGPDAVLKFNAFGKALLSRRIGVKLNSTIIDTTLHMDFFDAVRKEYAIPIGLLRTNADTIELQNKPQAKGGLMVVARQELVYPRLFNFGGASNFGFILPEKTGASYLEISNFSYGAAAPVLYDLTNGKRYVGDISAAPLVKFVIDPSETERRLVLVKNDVANTTVVASLQERKFINYTDAAYSSNYMIITNRQLLNAMDGSNPVEEYRAYRSSAAGGGYDAKIYLEDELADQFGYGIKKNPIAIRNFILYARNHFSPAHVFIVGKGVNYTSQTIIDENNSNTAQSIQNKLDLAKLNLVPTFGWPASDALLTADPGTSIPQLSFGRLSVINTKEVAVYLKKVKEYEQAQAALSPNRQDREWMKNVVHLNGISEPGLKEKIDAYFDKYKNIISDTLFGGKVITFAKSTTSTVEQISSSYLDVLFKQGITLMTYFGHSGSSTLSYNLDDPQAYNNKGKYPLFIALGCNAGDFFNFSAKRFIADETISEKYVLAEDRGTIGFIASTHFGIVHYLDVWNSQAYKELAATDYGAPIGDIMVRAAKAVFEVENAENFYAIANVEETELHGDPALRLNPHAKPDYVIDEALVKTAPDFVSIAEPFVKVTAKVINIGRAVNNDIVLEVKRQYPGGATEVVRRDTLTGVHYADSVTFTLPIDAMRDKGTSKITVTIDADNAVDELFETNNSVTKDIVIYEDELRPVYPYNYAIVNKQNIKLIASTADAFSASKEYRMELDTTTLFNSSVKVTKSVTSKGGLVEFDPGIAFSDSTVYYWRVAKVPESGTYNWNTASFIYLSTYETGVNQSHFYQHLKSEGIKIYLDSGSRQWNYTNTVHNLFARNAIFPTGGNTEADFTVAVDEDASYIRSACVGRSLIFNVFDARTFKPWKNVDSSGKSLNLYGSGSASCYPSRNYNFEFSYMTAQSRKSMMDFMDAIPKGAFVVVRSTDYSNNLSYSRTWLADTALYGSGKSLYHKLLEAGFNDIDSLDRPRAWILLYQKGNKSFQPKAAYTHGIYDKITLTTDVFTSAASGSVVSPLFGPAKQWDKLYWHGASLETPATDVVSLDVIGVKAGGVESVVYNGLTQGQQEVDLSGINAQDYPFLKLKLHTTDTVNITPYQLQYWRLTYIAKPEGAIAPNLYLAIKDTVEAGEPLDIQLAFKNVTETAFDSLKVKMVVTDANNVAHVLPVMRHRPLAANDTLHIRYNIDTRQFAGLNSLYIDVNPDNDQIEQYHFNNYAFKNFFVRVDSLNPMLDVTFDNMHILNNDIVSAKPAILIKLKDEAKWQLLNDTSLMKVQVKFPGETSARNYAFNNDTLRFTPAAGAADNTASINFNPHFAEDGVYELIVSGKDKSGNEAGKTQYRVAFEVINKPMISNLLNYPNPFTTSTAFVFTLTGSQIPPEFKIQVLTVTGKVVREITREELGPLRIGRNITEYKWDGTDQYGQKLANGVYLYRVVTSLNGKSLEKYKSTQDNTDKYFNKGYGKMYLMR